MDEQGGPTVGCSGDSGDGGAGRGCRGFSKMQGVRGMPSLHVDSNNRFTVLDIEEIDSDIPSQDMPTRTPTLELSKKPWME